jgi:YVTN family beta-propeller protein
MNSIGYISLPYILHFPVCSTYHNGFLFRFLFNKNGIESVIETITVGAGPYEDLFNPDNGHIYLADVFSNSVTVIDGSINTVIATITEQSNPL